LKRATGKKMSKSVDFCRGKALEYLEIGRAADQVASGTTI